MHQVLILSDSHGLTKELTELKHRHQQIKYMIHCGDSELPVDAPELEGIFQVKGNCDFGEPFPEEKEIHIGGLTFFITHGHRHRVKEGLMSLSYYVENKDIDVILYGHNHIANVNKIGKQIFINPGSIRYPRNRIEKTYAIMRWKSLDQIEINFYNLSGELLEHFQTSIS